MVLRVWAEINEAHVMWCSQSSNCLHARLRPSIRIHVPPHTSQNLNINKINALKRFEIVQFTLFKANT